MGQTKKNNSKKTKIKNKNDKVKNKKSTRKVIVMSGPGSKFGRSKIKTKKVCLNKIDL